MKKLITALATPFKNCKIDLKSYEKLLEFQLKNKVDELLVCGTTGEAQLLSQREKRSLVALTRAVAGKTPITVGVEGSATSGAVREAIDAQSWGADGLLIAPPAFCKCTAKGYFCHIKEILKHVTIPLTLYNVPSRCGYALDQSAVEQLSGSVRYVKDAGSDLDYTAALTKSVNVLCGSDGQLPQFLERGAVGVISVVSNVAPLLTRRVLDGKNLQEFHQLAKASMLEVNPIAIKYMLYKKGIFETYDMRLPLTTASEETRNVIDQMWSEDIL